MARAPFHLDVPKSRDAAGGVAAQPVGNFLAVRPLP
jgi:hypothetical protein